jgi:hypothetical protein
MPSLVRSPRPRPWRLRRWCGCGSAGRGSNSPKRPCRRGHGDGFASRPPSCEQACLGAAQVGPTQLGETRPFAQNRSRRAPAWQNHEGGVQRDFGSHAAALGRQPWTRSYEGLTIDLQSAPSPLGTLSAPHQNAICRGEDRSGVHSGKGLAAPRRCPQRGPASPAIPPIHSNERSSKHRSRG